MPVYTTGGASGSTAAYRTQWVTFYDVTNDTHFLRQYTVNASDAVTGTSDFELDGTTVYAASANIKAMSNYSIDSKVMEDDNQEFLRFTVYHDRTAVASFDKELDGTTDYTVVGTVHGTPVETSEIIPRLDDNGGITTPFWRLNRYRNGTLVSSTTINASGGAYTVTGTERPVSDQYELVDTRYLDVDDAAVYDLSDAETTIGGGAAALPADAVSALISVEITSTDSDGLPTGNLFVTVDGNAPATAGTPGDKITHKQKLILGEAAKGAADPSEIANFQVRGDTGITARLVAQIYRKR